MKRNPILIPVNSVTLGRAGDQMRISARHLYRLTEIAERGGYTSLGTLVNTILDAALPRVQLVERRTCELVLMDEEDDTGE